MSNLTAAANRARNLLKRREWLKSHLQYMRDLRDKGMEIEIGFDMEIRAALQELGWSPEAVFNAVAERTTRHFAEKHFAHLLAVQ